MREWFRDERGKGLAVVTGAVSGLVVLDFDGAQGAELLQRLGLRPHVRTGSGGFHVYFPHPGWRVKTCSGASRETLGRRYPGLDVRADGVYALVPPSRNARGPYEALRDPADLEPLASLPEDLRALLGLLHAPQDQTGRGAPQGERVREDVLLNRALEIVPQGGRHQGGGWLAAQLRDNGYGLEEARAVMARYTANVPGVNSKGQPEAYPLSEAQRTLDGIYAKPPREPWASAAPSEKSPSSSSLPIKDAAELFVATLPEPKYAVPGLLPEGLALLVSAPKVGKSWLALNVAVAIATGGQVLDQPVEQGDVLYLALEDHDRRLRDRLRQMLPGEDGEALRRLKYVTATDAFPALSEGGLEGLERWCAQVPCPRLIVVDVLSKALKGRVDFNDYGTMTAVLAPLQRLALRHGLCVLVVHHARKAQQNATDPFARVLGSTAVQGVADVIAVLDQPRMSADAVLALTGRGVEERELALRFARERGWWTLAQESPDLLRLSEPKRALVDAVAAGVARVTELAEHLGKGKSTISKQVAELCDQGVLGRNGDDTLFVKIVELMKPIEHGEQGDHPPDCSAVDEFAVGDETTKTPCETASAPPRSPSFTAARAELFARDSLFDEFEVDADWLEDTL